MATDYDKPTVLDQARECFDSDRCPIDGHPKRPRKDWFCIECFKSLPLALRVTLAYFRQPPIAEWQQAMAILKKERGK